MLNSCMSRCNLQVVRIVKKSFRRLLPWLADWELGKTAKNVAEMPNSVGKISTPFRNLTSLFFIHLETFRKLFQPKNRGANKLRSISLFQKFSNFVLFMMHIQN